MKEIKTDEKQKDKLLTERKKKKARNKIVTNFAQEYDSTAEEKQKNFAQEYDSTAEEKQN